MPVTPLEILGEADFKLLLLVVFEIIKVFELVLDSPETRLSASSYDGSDFVMVVAPFDLN
jgi:hypothetical protein